MAFDLPMLSTWMRLVLAAALFPLVAAPVACAERSGARTAPEMWSAPPTADTSSPAPKPAKPQISQEPCDSDDDCTLATLYLLAPGECCHSCSSRPIRVDHLQQLTATCSAGVSSSCPGVMCPGEPPKRAYCHRTDDAGRCASVEK